MAKFLMIGTGGREHALAWRLGTEGHEVVVAPGSAGIAQDARCADVKIDDFDGLVALARSEAADVAVVGPEAPLVDGLADRFADAGVACIGPGAAAAELEGSKAAAKAFMEAFEIPTARSITVASLEKGVEALGEFDAPPVVKADGLAAGKGVVVAETFDEARKALEACLADASFGAAGSRVVLEQRLHGQEVSFFALTDGTSARVFAPCQDHKRIGEGDTGPNTGGMGAYLPAPVFTDAVRDETMARIVTPTIDGLRAQGRPFVGILFFGLMIDEGGHPWVIEYNVRFGDPEAQPLLFGLQDELGTALVDAAHGRLDSGTLRGRPSATVVLASAGYPASSRKGDVISGLDAVAAMQDVKAFHAGTRRGAEGRWETAGGRVLGICAAADDLQGALDRAYRAVDVVSFDGRQHRRDIGAKALSR